MFVAPPSCIKCNLQVAKNEVNVPVLKNFVEMMYTPTLDSCIKRKHSLVGVCTCTHVCVCVCVWVHACVCEFSHAAILDTKISTKKQIRYHSFH